MLAKEFSSVLVIGGGLAGMYAALSAAEQGQTVTILCKKKTGCSGNSLVAMSVHRFPPAAPGLQQDYRERFIRSGAGQQREDTAAFYLNHAAEAMENSRRLQLPLYYRCLSENGKDFPYLACCDPKEGRILTAALRERIGQNTGITVCDNVAVTDLLCGSGRIYGALAIEDGAPAIYPAAAVVLATGGAGNIYAATSNTNDVTGDGYAMAARCGLTLTGMEFVQFYPYRIYSPRRADIFPDLFEHGAVFRNEADVRFMDSPEYPKKELENRDVVARAMFRQKKVRLDLTDCDLAYLERECPNIYKIYKTHPNEPLLLRPVAHFMMGGIPLRPDCATDIAGLFVCGEVTGGLHGANRLAGSALSETVLFGREAGKNAAVFAAQTGEHEIPEAIVTNLLRSYPAAGNDDLTTIVERLRRTMWENVSVVRTPTSLRKASADLAALAAEFCRCSPADLKRWSEVRNMLFTAQAVTDAALQRHESLGAHYILPDPQG